MKTLVLVRHAKSSWDYPDLTDYQRPLNKRGETDAPEMVKRLLKTHLKPDLILTSGAVRAITTAKIFANAFHYPEYEIAADDQLYHASSKNLLEFLRNMEHTPNILYLFGHNPGLTDFLNLLTDESIDNIPTCGIAGIEFEIAHWSQIKEKSGKLLMFDYPKKKQLLF